jgi:hypothetical protein
MLFRLIFLFAIFAVLSISVLEARESNFPFEGDKISSSSEIQNTYLEHCHDHSCSDSSHCCESLCGCSGSFFIISKINILFLSIPVQLNMNWVLFDNYHSPFIDPALKPPLFS